MISITSMFTEKFKINMKEKNFCRCICISFRMYSILCRKYFIACFVLIWCNISPVPSQVWNHIHCDDVDKAFHQSYEKNWFPGACTPIWIFSVIQLLMNSWLIKFPKKKSGFLQKRSQFLPSLDKCIALGFYHMKAKSCFVDACTSIWFFVSLNSNMDVFMADFISGRGKFS